MEPLLAIVFFVCLSCLIGAAGIVLLLFLLRRRLRGGMVFQVMRRTDRTVIDAEYSLSDADAHATPYAVDLETDQDAITIYPIDDDNRS